MKIRLNIRRKCLYLINAYLMKGTVVLRDGIIVGLEKAAAAAAPGAADADSAEKLIRATY